MSGLIKTYGKNTTKTPLPNDLEWCTLNVFDKQTLDMIYHLLKNNYVEDSNGMYQLEYSCEFLKWILTSPGYNPLLHLGLVYKSKYLIGFITGTNVKIILKNQIYKMAEINFLCIDKSVRNKNLAPLLIKEITRRIALTDTQIALYTISKKITEPFVECNYYNYYINIKKLQECKFINNVKFDLNLMYDFDYYYRHTRQMKESDCNGVCTLLNDYLSKFKIFKTFSNEEISHCFLPKSGIVYTNIIEDDFKNIIGMYSIVNIKTSILFKNKHESINICYLHYYAYDNTKINIENLMTDIIRFSKKNNFDCLNTLNNLDSTSEVLNKLNFYKNTTQLHYYLYNYNINSTILSNDIGVILL